MFNIDWQAMFQPSISPAELFIRGSLIYIALFLLLRFVPNRMSGTLGTADMLMIVLLATSAQGAIAGNARSVTDGLLLVVTVIFWSFAFNWLGHRFPRFQRLIRPAPLTLVRDGILNHANMRRELITKGELMTQLREQGIADLGQVRAAFMEADGRISVIALDERHPAARKQQTTISASEESKELEADDQPGRSATGEDPAGDQADDPQRPSQAEGDRASGEHNLRERSTSAP